jgi:hypothetical protein
VLCGSGEYTTGYVPNAAGVRLLLAACSSGSLSALTRCFYNSDKKAGVVALSFFEFRRLGFVKDIAIVGFVARIGYVVAVDLCE